MTQISDRHTHPSVEAAPKGSRAKDAAICAAILGGASIAWFGWGQAGQRLGPVLVTGMVLGVIALIAAVVTTVRTPGPPTMAVDPAVRRTYNLALVAEIVAILVAAFLLNRAGHSDLLPTVVLAVVGLHFLPLANAFRLPVVRYAAWASLVVAAVALWAGLADQVPAATVAGLGGGLVLLATSIASTMVARRA